MKATFPDGTVFEGTPEEFNVIRAHSAVAANGSPDTSKTTLNESTQVWNATNAGAFWHSLDTRHNGGKQRKVLELMIKKGGVATESEVRSHLNLKNGQQLAGVLANISRNARRETRNEKTRAVIRKHDSSGVSYHIPDELLKFLEDLE
jgi:hypothetical protein